MNELWPDFIKIAKGHLDPILTQGFTCEDSQACRGAVHLKLTKPGLKIEFGYEPCGPAWCFVTQGLTWREITVNTPNVAGTELSQALCTPAWSEALVEQHKSELHAWCIAVVEVLRRSGVFS